MPAQPRENIRVFRPLEMAVHKPEPMPTPTFLDRHGKRVGLLIILAGAACSLFALYQIHLRLCS